MSAKKSLEQRLYEAYQSGKGLILSAEDVDRLMFDEAIGTRITNRAASQLGLEEPGVDCTRAAKKGETWDEFLIRVKTGR